MENSDRLMANERLPIDKIMNILIKVFFHLIPIYLKLRFISFRLVKKVVGALFHWYHVYKDLYIIDLYDLKTWFQNMDPIASAFITSIHLQMSNNRPLIIYYPLEWRNLQFSWLFSQVIEFFLRLPISVLNFMFQKFQWEHNTSWGSYLPSTTYPFRYRGQL